MRATLATVVLGMLALAPGAAAAQPMTPTENQRAHNDRGVQHMFDGEFEQAAASFKASLAMGESNIVWLNYGRALFKLQRCHEARTAFERVPAAPEVVAPSPEEIAVVLDRFSVEWSAECSGRLSLECPDEPAMVRVDGSEAFPCHADPIPVVPGVHEIAVAGWDEPVAVRVDAEPVLVSLQRSLTPPPEESDDEVAPEPIDMHERQIAGRDGGARPLVGLTLAGVGVAGLATSLALEVAWVSPRFDAYRAAQTPTEWDETRAAARNAQRANRVLFFGSLGVTAVGAALFAIPARSGPVALRVGVGPSVTAEVVW